MGWTASHRGSVRSIHPAVLSSYHLTDCKKSNHKIYFQAFVVLNWLQNSIMQLPVMNWRLRPVQLATDHSSTEPSVFSSTLKTNNKIFVWVLDVTNIFRTKSVQTFFPVRVKNGTEGSISENFGARTRKRRRHRLTRCACACRVRACVLVCVCVCV